MSRKYSVVAQNYPATYTPNRVFNRAAAILKVDSDIKLSDFLGIAHGRISHVRSRREPFSASLVLRIMVRTGLTLNEIVELSGLTIDHIVESR